HQRSDESADIRSRIEEAGRQRAFLLREPFSDCFERSWEPSRFAQPERKPCRAETEHGSRESVTHRGKAPHDDGERETFPGAKPVHDSADNQVSDGIRRRK